MLESEQQTAATTAARRSSSSTSTIKKTSGRAGLLSRTSLKKKSSTKAKKGMYVCSRLLLCFPAPYFPTLDGFIPVSILTYCLNSGGGRFLPEMKKSLKPP